MNDFFRFPHTPHLAWLSQASPRGDKVLMEHEVGSLLSGPVILEEKLDGANLGISIAPDGNVRFQNRGSYLSSPYTGQFEKLKSWQKAHENLIFDTLGESLILFGEWCAARHSLDYSNLPDFFLGFDVYDKKEKKFWSTPRRDKLLAEMELSAVPKIANALLTLTEIKKIMVEKLSAYRSGNMEGMVIRKENDEWLLQRAKIVRPDFTQSIQEHWRRRGIEWNSRRSDY